MDIRVSARFWSRDSEFPKVKFLNDREFATTKRLPPRDGKSVGEFYASTGDFLATSNEEALNIVKKTYGAILECLPLLEALKSNRSRGEVWVVSFGPECDIEKRITPYWRK